MPQAADVLERPKPRLRKTRAVRVCDLCGGVELEVVAEASADRCRTVMCRGCGLFFASPSLAIEELNNFYDEEFEGDAGTSARLVGGGIETRKMRKEERIARKWALPTIKKYMKLDGARVLDIRCRSGALAEALTKAGARVTAIDPLQPNVQQAFKGDGIAQVRFVPVTEYDRLVENAFTGYDAITALTIHILGHLPSPMAFLKSAHDALKPGGYLFIDEKDLFHPERAHGHSVFDSGVAHFFHLTVDTVDAYLRAAGYEVVICKLDRKRKKDFRHMRIVARRPETASAPAPVPACNPEKRLAKLRSTERMLRAVRGINLLARKTRAGIRKVWS